MVSLLICYVNVICIDSINSAFGDIDCRIVDATSPAGFVLVLVNYGVMGEASVALLRQHINESPTPPGGSTCSFFSTSISILGEDCYS